jgi:hypothetical protein
MYRKLVLAEWQYDGDYDDCDQCDHCDGYDDGCDGEYDGEYDDCLYCTRCPLRARLWLGAGAQ